MLAKIVALLVSVTVGLVAAYLFHQFQEARAMEYLMLAPKCFGVCV